MQKYNYNKLNEYLKNKYGERTLKICIDGGFTCPNRDGKISTGGCIFCSGRGSGEHINEKLSIKEQVENYFSSYRAKRANKFIAYFQNFTNTYDSIENLEKKYNEALINEQIVCLSIATRPDCIDENICKLLVKFKEKVDVWVELGLQTSNDIIGRFINRGYDSETFTKALKLLNKYGLETIVHIMVGLPNETFEDVKDTVKFLNEHNYQGIKIHSTYVVKETVLDKLYEQGKYVPMELDYYIETACYVITHINPNVVIHKISGDAPKNLLVSPEWNLHKKLMLNGINKYLSKNNLHQGMYFK
ncbi:MAG: TIGR01212 family radical SAM protein [Clostridia bacterium]|nr:TIGR01212 family radical SAM protein [Clostridia bacterium]